MNEGDITITIFSFPRNINIPSLEQPEHIRKLHLEIIDISIIKRTESLQWSHQFTSIYTQYNTYTFLQCTTLLKWEKVKVIVQQ